MAGIRNEDGQRKCPRLSKDSPCLSDLPDKVLLHILSFLPTKSVVATSLLSRRWQYLWASALNLQLDVSLFRGRMSRFMNFAERAFVFREGSPLVSFSLSYPRSYSVRNDATRINTWITSAIRCNVEQFSLNLNPQDRTVVPFSLPCCLFWCHSLVKLDIMYWRMVRVPSSMVSLPRLKHLELKFVEFVDDKSTEKLLSHPLLEKLIISNCIWDEVMAVNVNSPMLQSLIIGDFDKEDWSIERQVCFFGDNFKFFCYEGELPPVQYCICGSTMQLREAEFFVRLPNLEDVLYMDRGPSNRYRKLVNSLSRVQNLTLSDDTVNGFYQLLQHCPELQTTIPVFEHVTRLNLIGHLTVEIDSLWIAMIFKRCPNLEHLNIMTALGGGTLFSMMPIPSCFRTHLKKITVHSYYPECQDQVNTVHVLLNSATVLEEMVLHKESYGLVSGNSSDEVMIMERELNKCPKLSKKCRVSILRLD